VFRAVTLNLWGEQPPLERRMRGVIDGLRALDADLIALQEVRQIPGVLPNQAETIAAALGMNVHSAMATPWGGGEEGLALLSRHPIGEPVRRELPHATPEETRIAIGITADTPLGPLRAFTTHLTYRLHDGQKREDQIVALEALVAETPSELPKLVMGDFNAVPDSDEIRWLKGLRSVAGRRAYYQDAFAMIHPDDPGHTWARENPFTSRLEWLQPGRRIDYIFVTPRRRDGRGIVRDCRVVLDRADETGCHPSDHYGLLADVQISKEGE
jgi:endonuclease/exonuclease/phosphatase family metal-dependent hydrolase